MAPRRARRGVGCWPRSSGLRGTGGRGERGLSAGRVRAGGAGGLGCPALAYLAAAGVGRSTLVDDDAVSVKRVARRDQRILPVGHVGNVPVENRIDLGMRSQVCEERLAVRLIEGWVTVAEHVGEFLVAPPFVYIYISFMGMTLEKIFGICLNLINLSWGN